MGIKLIVEVLDHAPPELTPAERLLLVVLAEQCNDTTREWTPADGLVARRTGLSPTGLRGAFQRLAKRELEVRVPVGTIAAGKRADQPVYSYPGRRTRYRIPHLTFGDATTSPFGDATESPLQGMATSQSRNGDATASPYPSSPPPKKSPPKQDPSSLRATADASASHEKITNPLRVAVKILTEELGLSPSEARALADKLLADEESAAALPAAARRLVAIRLVMDSEGEDPDYASEAVDIMIDEGARNPINYVRSLIDHGELSGWLGTRVAA